MGAGCPPAPPPPPPGPLPPDFPRYVGPTPSIKKNASAGLRMVPNAGKKDAHTLLPLLVTFNQALDSLIGRILKN